MSRKITITLPDDIAHTLEVRAAIDGLKLEQGIELLLTVSVQNWRQRK